LGAEKLQSSLARLFKDESQPKSFDTLGEKDQNVVSRTAVCGHRLHTCRTYVALVIACIVFIIKF